MLDFKNTFKISIVISSVTHIYFNIILVENLPFFNGWCMYGSNEFLLISENKVPAKTAMYCLQHCRVLQQCVAFVFFTDLGGHDVCYFYKDGPYTYGDEDYTKPYGNNSKCYIMPSGMSSY